MLKINYYVLIMKTLGKLSSKTFKHIKKFISNAKHALLAASHNLN